MIREIVNADARDYIKYFDNNSIDLIILDPDYNDYHNLLKDKFIEECIRVLKDTGNLICFTKQPFDFELRNYIDNYFRRELVWTFTNGGAWCSSKMPLMSFQKLYWCVKTNTFFFNPRKGLDYSEKTKNFKRASKMFGGWKEEGKEFVKSSEGVWIRDHLHFNKPLAGGIPAKPKELIKIIIRCFCPQGGTIYDPFSGTGTIVKVGNEMGCEVFASEINKERCMKYLGYDI